jgi:seryl-tRNA synthetase
MNGLPLRLISMLDMKMFREFVDILRADHDKREMPYDDIEDVIRLDEEWRQTRYDVDQLRKKRNEAARGIAQAIN